MLIHFKKAQGEIIVPTYQNDIPACCLGSYCHSNFINTHTLTNIISAPPRYWSVTTGMLTVKETRQIYRNVLISIPCTNTKKLAEGQNNTQ